MDTLARVSTLDAIDASKDIAHRNMELDALTDLVMRAPDFGQLANTSVQENRELWILDGLCKDWLPSALARVKAMERRANCIATVTIPLAVMGFFGITVFLGMLVNVQTPSPMMWLSAGTLLLATLCTGRTFKIMCNRQIAMNKKAFKLESELWPMRLSRVLMRPECPDLPPLLVRMGEALAARNKGFDAVRLSEISPADHVAMMRLASNLYNVERKPLSRSEVILDGDTREACCRVLEVLDVMGRDAADIGPQVMKTVAFKL